MVCAWNFAFGWDFKPSISFVYTVFTDSLLSAISAMASRVARFFPFFSVGGAYYKKVLPTKFLCYGRLACSPGRKCNEDVSPPVYDEFYGDNQAYDKETG